MDLYHIPNNFQTQEIFNNAVWEDPSFLQYVPDWFVTQQQIGLWDDNMIIMMMINLLVGMIVMKNGRPRNQK